MNQLRPGAPKVSHACKKHSLVDTERSFCATNLRRRHISRPRHDRRLCSPGASAASRSINLQGLFLPTAGQRQQQIGRSFLFFLCIKPPALRKRNPREMFCRGASIGRCPAAGLCHAGRCPVARDPLVDAYLNSVLSLHVLVYTDRKACLYMAVGLLEVCGVLSPH